MTTTRTTMGALDGERRPVSGLDLRGRARSSARVNGHAALMAAAIAILLLVAT